MGAAANGATAGAFIKGMAIGSVAGMIAVPIADGAAAWMGFAADTLGHAIAHGTVVGALSSAMTAAVYGQDIWKAMRTGALLGGGTAAVVHLYGPKGRASDRGTDGDDTRNGVSIGDPEAGGSMIIDPETGLPLAGLTRSRATGNFRTVFATGDH